MHIRSLTKRHGLLDEQKLYNFRPLGIFPEITTQNWHGNSKMIQGFWVFVAIHRKCLVPCRVMLIWWRTPPNWGQNCRVCISRLWTSRGRWFQKREMPNCRKPELRRSALETFFILIERTYYSYWYGMYLYVFKCSVMCVMYIGFRLQWRQLVLITMPDKQKMQLMRLL